jgi:hypothetical protein
MTPAEQTLATIFDEMGIRFDAGHLIAMLRDRGYVLLPTGAFTATDGSMIKIEGPVDFSGAVEGGSGR